MLLIRRCTVSLHTDGLRSFESFLFRSSASYTGSLRSHLCGKLSREHIGQPVRVCGWLQKKRMGEQFWLLRDWTGLLQVLISEQQQQKWMDVLQKASLESVIAVCGIAQPRPEGQTNPDMLTGEIEVHAEEIKLLNPAQPNLPFLPHNRQVTEQVRLRYRYLDFRQNAMQHALRLRSSVLMKMRQFLHDQHGFVDVETPYLFRRTPGGAREFLVPSQQAGKFYSLPQSPQQFKQLLMVGGLDRYFQIARCFRDESRNPEKQPEFTQLDIEMSFVDAEGILRLIEDLVVASWPSSLLGSPPSLPFRRLSYAEAMNCYGSDKPDTRFGMKLQDISTFARQHCLFGNLTEDANWTVLALVVPNGATHCRAACEKQAKIILENELRHKPRNKARLGVTRITQENTEDRFTGLKIPQTVQRLFMELLGVKAGDAVVMCAGEDRENCQKGLGKVRLFTADYLEENGLKVRRDASFNFLWVVDFPLFVKSDEGHWESAHHPFTAPLADDMRLLNDADRLGEIRGQHYDLVLNGAEVGGGSIRVHQAAMQSSILDLLRIEKEELTHLLEALDSGCPPHGGIALGLDRLISIYAGSNSIRDVIAFPKTAAGNDLMSSSPCLVPQPDLDFYHISVNKSVNKACDNSLDLDDSARIKATTNV